MSDFTPPSASGTVVTGVQQLVAGSNVTLNPLGGTGVVTVNAAGGAFVQTNSTPTYYKVYQSGGTTYAVDLGTGLIAASGATASTVLNTLIGKQTGSNDIVIEIDSKFAADSGAVTVGNPYINIWAIGTATNGTSTAPSIPTLVLNDNAGQIIGCYFGGITITSMTRNAGGAGHSYNTWEACQFIATGGNGSIQDNYEYNGTGSGMQYSDFWRCEFNEQNTTLASQPPALWLMNTGTGSTSSNGHNRLHGCTYSMKAGTPNFNLYFIRVWGGLTCGPPIIDSTDLDFVSATSSASLQDVMIWFDLSQNTLTLGSQAAQTSGTSQQANATFTGGYIESNAATHLVLCVNITGSYNTLKGGASFENVKTLAAGVTILQAAAPQNQAATNSGVVFHAFSPDTSALVQLAGNLNIAAGLAQGTGATAPVLTNTGVGGTAHSPPAWHVDVQVRPGPLGFSITTPTLPNSTVYLANLFLFDVEVVCTAAGTNTQTTIKDQAGNTTNYGPAVVGSTFKLKPLEQIASTYSVAPTFIWRGL